MAMASSFPSNQAIVVGGGLGGARSDPIRQNLHRLLGVWGVYLRCVKMCKICTKLDKLPTKQTCVGFQVENWMTQFHSDEHLYWRLKIWYYHFWKKNVTSWNYSHTVTNTHIMPRELSTWRRGHQIKKSLCNHVYCILYIHPWKLEPKNHPIEKEKSSSKPAFSGSMLIFLLAAFRTNSIFPIDLVRKKPCGVGQACLLPILLLRMVAVWCSWTSLRFVVAIVPKPLQESTEQVEGQPKKRGGATWVLGGGKHRGQKTWLLNYMFLLKSNPLMK